MTEPHAIIIDGKALAEQWLGDIAAQVRAMGAPVHLAAVCADPPDEDTESLKAFVDLKKKAAQKTGIQFSAYYPETELEARQTLLFLAKDEDVHGVFIELPLPGDWDHDSLLRLVPLKKDIDLITPEGMHAFHEGSAGILPPSVSALARVLEYQGLELRGLSAAVIGQGNLVGKPIIHWLRRQGSEVSVIDIDTKEPESIAAAADLIVSGAGVPELVNTKWIKKGATVIDFGYTKKGDGYVGDVTDAVRKKAGALTPVPGGMGPLVVAATLENLISLAVE